MNVSVLDPFGPQAAGEFREWLARRNRLDDDEAVLEYIVPLSGMLQPEQEITTRLSAVPRLVPSWRLARAHRSREGRIGLFECDLITLLNRSLWWHVLAVRTAFVAIVVAACAPLAVPGRVTVLLSVAAWAMTGWRGRLAFPLLGACVAYAIWTRLSLSLPVLAAAVLFAQVRLILWAFRTGLLSRRARGGPVAFLGRWFLLRALWDRTAASVLLAVDKASHDDRARAGLFVDGRAEAAGVRLRPVLAQCQAMVAVADVEFQRAMVLSERARELAVGAPEEIRGWCALQAGDVLLAAGQPAAAEARWQEAADLLSANRRGRYWAVQADLRMIEALTADLEETERCVRGLRILYRVRRDAVRAGQLPLLNRTELYLLRMMHEAGNTVGVVEHLSAQFELTEGKVAIGASVADHAAENLLLATLYLDIIENPQRYPETMRVGEDEQRERYAYAAELVDNVLRHLSRSTQPLLEAQAYAVMARIQAAVGLREAALGNVLESLNAVQRVRYQLPTTQWRARWVAAHAHTYALALELAEADPSLVGELLEIIRSQSVPVEAGRPGNLLRSVFDALIAGTGLPAGAGGPGDRTSDAGGPPDAVSVTDPLLTDRTILIQHASWIGGEERLAVNLDDELNLMFPGGWYWSFARVGEWIHHAVRTPSGDWSSERRPYAELAGPLTDLLRHLPVDLPGEDGYLQRLEDTAAALVAEGADEPVDGNCVSAAQAWARIFDALGAALLPTALRGTLSAAQAPVTLVLAPTASLSLVPVCALPVSPQRQVMDVARLSYAPSFALLAHRRRLSEQERDGASAPGEGSRSRVLAVLAPHRAPDDPRQDLPYAARSVPDHSETAVGPLAKQDLAVLAARRRSRDSVLYLAGHVHGAPDHDPASTGFQFRDGLLGLRDFYRTDEAGEPVYRIPRRVVLSGCASLGLYADPAEREGRSPVDAPEWLGLGAAVVYGGAHHVHCTLFPVPDSEHTRRIDLALVDAMRRHLDPAEAIRSVQRAETQRWRDGRGSLPLVFLAYAYVGIGAAPQHGTTRAPETVRRPEYRTSTATPGQTLASIRPRTEPRPAPAPFAMMARHGYDEAGCDDRLSPNLCQDGSVEFKAVDGDVHGPVRVRAATWTRQTLPPGGFRMRSETVWRLSDLSLYITGARLVLVADRPDRDQKKIAGHVRYPWINAIGFRPKQSFLYDCELTVGLQQDNGSPDELGWFYELKLILAPDTDSAALAQQVTRRLARHHLTRGAMPDAAIPGFETLREAPRLPDPAKGEHATYYPGAFKPYPYGVEYLIGRPAEGTWLGPGLPTAE